jgi:hypothetical protein
MDFQKLYFPLLLAALFMVACGSPGNEEALREETKDNTSADAPQTIEEAFDEVRKDLNGEEASKELVNFRALKDLMPSSLLGMDRTTHDGEQVKAFGMELSTAKAKYKAGSRTVEVNIVDFAGITAVLSGMASWADIEVDRESDDGFERTLEIDGYKAFEKYDTKGKYGELSVIVDGRFVVSIKGRNLEASDMREVLRKINLKKLAKLQ